jgi:hypothetical protein
VADRAAGDSRPGTPLRTDGEDERRQAPAKVEKRLVLVAPATDLAFISTSLIEWQNRDNWLSEPPLGEEGLRIRPGGALHYLAGG